jgi:hypothetical protein
MDLTSDRFFSFERSSPELTSKTLWVDAINPAVSDRIARLGVRYKRWIDNVTPAGLDRPRNASHQPLETNSDPGSVYRPLVSVIDLWSRADCVLGIWVLARTQWKFCLTQTLRRTAI